MAAIKSIEEKAKAYDEAIKRAKELLEIGVKDTRDKRVVLSFFPELAESEDKKMIQYFKDLAPFDNAEELYEKYGFSHKDAIAWLEKKGEQKSAEWIEEDERNFDIIYGIIYNSCNAEDASRLIAWLKAIKARVQPQQKQEWSEEDKAILEKCIGAVKVSCYSYSFKSEAENWLKSLRPQNWTKEDKERYISCLQRLSTGNPEQPETINSKWFKEHVYPQSRWKPSATDIQVLEDVIDRGRSPINYHATLHGILEQLKKLREE